MKKQYFLHFIILCIFCLTMMPISAYQSLSKDSVSSNDISMNTTKQEEITQIFNQDKIKIYPNPVSEGGKLTVEVPEHLGELNIFLYNTVGKIIQTVKTTNKKIDITAPDTSGIYLLKFVEKQKVVTVEKIVVKN